MKNYSLRGFIIFFTIMFTITMRGCKSVLIGSSENYFFLTITSIVIGILFGVIGLIIGKNITTSNTPIEETFVKKYKYYLLSFFIVCLFGIYFYKSWSPLIFDKPITSELKNNLENLHGTWSWFNSKDAENWYLNICLSDKEQLTGNYALFQKYSSWGESKEPELKMISSGKFKIKEGYDYYGDKAYLGEDVDTKGLIFVINQLDNPYASDWHLRIGILQDIMFSKQMTKTNNDCVISEEYIKNKDQNDVIEYINKGEKMLSTNDIDGAINEFNKAVNLDDKFAATYSKLAEAYSKKKDYASALKFLDQYLALDTSNQGGNMYFRGTCNTLLGKYNEAMEDFNNGMKFAKTKIDSAHHLNGIGGVYAAMKKYEEAEYHYHKSINCDSTNVALNELNYLGLGEIAAAVEHYDLAIKYYSKVLNINPKNYTAYNNRGRSKYFIKDFTGAIEDCKMAIQGIPDNPRPYYHMANSYFELGDLNNACANWNISSDLGDKEALQKHDLNCR